MICNNPVKLFRHVPVKRAEPRLNMADRDMKFRCGKGTCKDCVGVTLDEDYIGGFLFQDPFNPQQYLPCLLCLGS